MNARLQKISLAITNWVGTPASVLVHTILFAVSFGLLYFGISLNDVLLALTTIVSLEAIYLAIFIQMTVNRHTEHLEEVGADIEDIQEEVEDLGEDVEDISEDIEKIQEEKVEEDTEEAEMQTVLFEIQTTLRRLLTEMETIKAKNHSGPNPAQNVASPVEPIQNSEPEEASKREPHYLKRIMNFISLKGKPHETGSPDAPETFSAEEG